MNNLYLTSVILIMLSFSACKQAETQSDSNPSGKLVASNDNQWAEYWFQGLAEINSYTLIQNRYGELRKGEAILIFVTEDFSKEKQVKLDNPKSVQSDEKSSVLKLNRIHRFNTGVYDYSLMQSVFTPIDLTKPAHSYKTTTSVQDWCGQVFGQLNLINGKYQLQSFSYFEKEGDKNNKLPLLLLEDELFSLLRMNPSFLEKDKFELLPSQFNAFLFHKKIAPQEARIRFESTETNRFALLEFFHEDRTLRIDFEHTFPFRILGWEDKIEGKLITKATLRSTLKSPYWQKNNSSSSYLRDSLQLNN